MSGSQKATPGDLTIDATNVKVVSLLSEQIQKKIKVRDGFKEAVGCLSRLTPVQTTNAGINGVEVQRAITLKGEYDQCEELLPVAEKLVELLSNTRIERGHQISIILSELASQVRRRSEHDPLAAEVLGTISELLDYVSAPALKAVATKAKLAKNAAEENAAEEEAAESVGHGAGEPKSARAM